MKVVQRRMNGKKLAPRCNGAKKRRILKNREEQLVTLFPPEAGCHHSPITVCTKAG